MIKFKKALVPAIAALVAGVIFAAAANTTFVTSIGDLVFPFKAPLRDGTAGTIDNMRIGVTTPRDVNGTTGNFTGAVAVSGVLTAPQINAALGTYAKDPASGASYPSYTFANAQTEMIFTATGTQSYAYVTLAASPIDGAEQCIFSAGAITFLYVNANAGQTIGGAVTTLAANARVCYKYSLSNTKWNRSQ